MGVKNVNILEQNVEKIVLAVAAAGAAFMGYLAFQPVTIPSDPNNPDSESIASNDIEQAINIEISKMESKAEEIEKLQPRITLPDYAAEYRRLASGQPLLSTIASVRVPAFAPNNMSPSRIDMPSGDVNQQIVTPRPVAPELLTAEEKQQLVVAALPPAGAAPGPVAMRDQNATLIQGYIPVGSMILDMVQGKDRNEVVEKALVYRIRVQRRERTATGWSEFTEVKPTKATPPPSDIDWKAVKSEEMPTQLAQVEAEFQQIVIPGFYPDATLVPIDPPILTQPLPKSISEEIHRLQAAIDQAKSQPGIIRSPLTPGPAAAPGAGAPPESLPQSIDQIRSLEVIPFAFWDETVQPDHTYQYQVKVEFVNPTYQYAYGLKDPTKKSEPILTTGWVNIPNPIAIHSDIAFFVIGPERFGGPTGPLGADVRVFKQNEGKWYYSIFTAQPGTNISGKIDLVDKRDHAGIPSMDVDTKYMVVDAQPVGDSNVRLVLKDPSGNLVTRDSSNDRDDPSNAGLLAKSTKLTAATAPSTDSTLTPTPTIRSGTPGTMPQIRPTGSSSDPNRGAVLPTIRPTSGDPNRGATQTPIRTPVPVNPPRTPVLVNPPRTPTSMPSL